MALTDPNTVQSGSILARALPYIQAFSGKTFVIKYGGSSLSSADAVESLVKNVLLLQNVGIHPILVHGGGPEIDLWLKKLGIEKKTKDGIRVTDPETMDVVEMVLSGRSNKSLVSLFSKFGGRAVGISGRDGGLFVAEPISEEYGRAGQIVGVESEILRVLLGAGFVPIVATISSDVAGNPLNVNADTAAAAIAASLGATKLILLTDTNGVLADREKRDSTIGQLTTTEAKAMITNGKAAQGMIPKLEAAITALEDGVKQVHLINARTPNALLLEIFTEEGFGTMITRD